MYNSTASEIEIKHAEFLKNAVNNNQMFKIDFSKITTDIVIIYCSKYSKYFRSKKSSIRKKYLNKLKRDELRVDNLNVN